MCVTSTTTVIQMIGSVLAGMRQHTMFQEPDRRFLYFLKGNNLNNDLHETLVKDLGVDSNNIIGVNVYDKNDRVYRLATGQEVNDNEDEESSDDEQDFEEVEGDDFAYGFDETEQVDDGLLNRGNNIKVQVKTQDGSHTAGVYLPPSALVGDLKAEIDWLTELGDGYRLYGQHSRVEWTDDMTVASLMPDDYVGIFQLRLRAGGVQRRDPKKVAVKSKNLKEKMTTIRASTASSRTVEAVVEVEKMYEEFYGLADANASIAFETFGNRLNETQLGEIVAVLGSGSAPETKLKEIGDKIFSGKLQEVKTIYEGMASAIENSTAVAQWAFNRAIEQNNGNYDMGKVKKLFGDILTKKVAVREAKAKGEMEAVGDVNMG